MENQTIKQLEERVKKLEENQISVIMSFNSDMNVLRSVQRGVTTNSLAFGKPSAVRCAILELSSLKQGLVVSRMTTAQRDLVPNPVAGLIIYNTTTNKLNLYTTLWEAVTSA